MPHQDQNNVHQLGAFSAEDMLASLAELRNKLISAWRERAVMLTPDEQNRLKREIEDSYSLLTELIK